MDPEGSAARIEWRHESSRLIARAFGAITDPGFSNPASTLTGGRTEAGGRARLTITDAVHIIGEAIHSEDRLTDGRRDGGLLAVETKWRPLVFELGLRRATETGAPAQGTSAGFPLFGSQTPSGGFGFGSTNTSIDPVTGQPTVQPGFGAAAVGRRERAGDEHAARRHDRARRNSRSSSGSARTCTVKANRTCARRSGASPPSARSS